MDKKRYFHVSYQASCSDGLIWGCLNVVTQGSFLNRRKLSNDLLRDNTNYTNVVVISFTEISEQDWPNWIA